MYFLAVYRLRW